MSQIFYSRANTLARAGILGAVAALSLLGVVAWGVDRSPYITNQGVVRDQPVPFSHLHHVRDLGMDCRYCHTAATDSSFAGIPPTKTCMTCHSRIWTDAPLLDPVRQSWSTGVPLKWTRVNNLPDFVYFRHDIHISKGVSCVTCHGQVDQMPLMFQHASLQMRWCLQCHDNPGQYLRPRDQVFNVNFVLDDRVKREYSDAGHVVTDQQSLGKALVDRYHVPTDGRLINCYTCHR